MKKMEHGEPKPPLKGPSKKPRLELACADFTFPLLEHDRVLDLIGLLDVPAVDIGLFEGRSHLWPSRVFKRVDASARALARKLADRGLEAADVFLQTALDFVSFAPNHPDARRRRKARDWFQRTIDFAEGLGCRHVTALPGVRFRGESPRASFERASEELAWRCAEAAARGMVFSVEAHVGSIAPVPRAALRLVEATPGLTLTLDYTHFTRQGFSDAEIEPLVRHASHFHVRGARKGRLQVPFKDNAIDYRRVLGAMRRAGYDGYLGLEYVWNDWQRCNEADTISETILFRDFLRSLA